MNIHNVIAGFFGFIEMQSLVDRRLRYNALGAAQLSGNCKAAPALPPQLILVAK